MRMALVLSIVLAALTGPAAAAEPAHRSLYAGQEARDIKSLSPEDIDELRNGRGWGLAKAAELNGMPGPAHLLELRKEIALTSRQVERIEALYRAMKSEAMELGIRLIELERGLNDSFAKRTVTQASLDAHLGEIAGVRKALRLTHLETHLRTPGLLTKHQIATYNRLRGYTAGSPHGAGHGGHGKGGG
jgi:hypothetical protein